MSTPQEAEETSTETWNLRQRIGDVLERLATRRPLFHSEADFQHELAWELRESGFTGVRLERPYQVQVEGTGRKTQSRRIYLDLFCQYEGLRIGIELKYLTKEPKIPKGKEAFDVKGEPFRLANQGAQPVRRFQFCSDIARLLALKEQGEIDQGVALLLTNDPSYWDEGIKERTGKGEPRIDENFRLHEGAKLNTNKFAWEKDPETGKRQTKAKVILQNKYEYEMNWADYRQLENIEERQGGLFRHLLIEV